MKLTAPQIDAAIGILQSGKCELSKDSDPDYVEAAAFVLDNGCMFFPNESMDYLIEARRSFSTGRSILDGGREK